MQARHPVPRNYDWLSSERIERAGFALPPLEEGLANLKGLPERVRKHPGISLSSHLHHEQRHRQSPPSSITPSTKCLHCPNKCHLIVSFSNPTSFSLFLYFPLPFFFPFCFSLPLPAKAPAGILESSHCPAFTVCGQHQTNRL